METNSVSAELMSPLSKRDQGLGSVISFFALSLLLLFIGMAIVGFDNEAILGLTFGLVFLISFLLVFLLSRRYRKQNKPLMIDYLNLGLQRCILALFMVLYGIPKLTGDFFDYQLFALDSKLNDISEFELAWFFYGKNHWQELLSGVMEFVPGVFLLWRRSYYVAALVLLPVTVQVFLLNLFFKIGGITFQAAFILLACNMYILYSQKDKILQFFKSLHFSHQAILNSRQKTVIKWLRGVTVVLLLLVVVIKLRPVFSVSVRQRAYQKLVGVYHLSGLKKNGIAVTPVKESRYYKDLYFEKQPRWNILRMMNDNTEAFLLDLNSKNDSLTLFLNKGGIGDGPDIPDSATVLKGRYSLKAGELIIYGVQMGDTLELQYRKEENIKPKEWFW